MRETMDRSSAFLSTTPPGRVERRLALLFVLGSVGAFLAAAPFATMPLPAVPAFLPVYQSALVVTDLITGVLLLGQFTILRSQAILVLANAYFFSACMAAAHALSFPGLFSPTGLLGAGQQTTAWLYFLWHGSFPLFIIAYAMLKDGGPSPGTAPVDTGARPGISGAVLFGMAATLAFAAGQTALATAGHDVLPVIMQGDTDANTKVLVASAAWALTLAALAVLWVRRPHSVLDLWLMVVMCAWVFDIALSAVLNEGRYDLGWYAGRIYGLLAASFVLVVLLLENTQLHAQLVAALAGESRERRLVQDKSVTLTAVNRELDASIRALHDSSSRMRSILETVVDGIITIDERGIVQTVNPAAERIFGYPASELVGSNVKMLMPEPYHGQHDGYLERYRATSEERVIGVGREVMGRRKDGSTFPLELAVSEMRLGAERHFTGVVRDITARREAERAVVAARVEAEQANAAKGMFLATMSHEIRTPLNGLLGMLELLSLSPLEGEQRESLEIARDSGRGLVRIIDDVLDHARIEAGKLEIRPEPVSVAQLLRRVQNTYYAVASSRDLALTHKVDPRISPALLVDPLRLLQILNNLVSNALKFTAKGRVEVRAEFLHRAAGVESVRICVEDTGIGIAPEAQERLFQPFEQAGVVTARLYGGTGLGLSICRRLTELMGGTIEMQSKPGAGTTMSLSLTLPIAEAAPAEHRPQAASVPDPLIAFGERPLVLAVDDHPTNCELLARQLATLGLRVRKAEDGQKALALWREGGIALVITDCNMPEMDGTALSRAIRDIEAREGRARTPIIAWTANVLPSAVTQCQAAGMDDILTKPADLAAVREAVSKWLGVANVVAAGRIERARGLAGDVRVATFDPHELDRIATTAADRAEILRDFMTQTRSDFNALGASLRDRELPASARIAHRMKGSSRMVGAQELAAACEMLEIGARQGSEEQANAAKVALERALERLEARVSETVGSWKEGE